MLAGFLFLLLFTGGSTSNHSEPLDDQQKSNHSFEENGEFSNSSCSRWDIIQYLNLTKTNELHTMTPPVTNSSALEVNLGVALYAILDVNEKDQKFISYIWRYLWWENAHISWDPNKFCGIEMITLPTEVFWKPDIIIQEMIEKDKKTQSPYVSVRNDGDIMLHDHMVVISTCRMQVYKFPFDVLSCKLSFRSLIYPDDEVQLKQALNSSKTTEFSRLAIQTQSEWLFINITVTNSTCLCNFLYNQTMIIYTINMRRRSSLYIVNFILPVLFFLCLDLSSFLISDSSGEKLSFKVTVLLAVTVMQLILNEILPSSSDRIPLAAIYCIGIFALMMLSLIETILVMHLIEKDSATQDNEADKDQSLSEDCGNKLGKVSCCKGETSSDLMLVAKEGMIKGSSSSQLTAESHDFEKLKDELREVETTLTLIHRKEERKPGYWTRMAKTINKAFFIFYVTAATVFLLCMLSIWISAENGSDGSDE